MRENYEAYSNSLLALSEEKKVTIMHLSCSSSYARALTTDIYAREPTTDIYAREPTTDIYARAAAAEKIFL